MKKCLTIIVAFACFGAFAQKEIARKVNALQSKNVDFKEVSVLSVTKNAPNALIEKAVTKATYAKMNAPSLSDLMARKYENIEVEIPYQGVIIEVQLYKVNLLAEGFHVDTDKATAVPYEPGLYYRGIVKGDPNSTVSFNFFKDEMNGIISNDALHNLVIGKLDQPYNTSDYVIYSDADLTATGNLACHTKEQVQTQLKTIKEGAKGVATSRCATIYFEIDHAIYTANGSDVTTTTNWMTAVFNNVQTLFGNDGIPISLKSTFIWTSPDPYTGSSSTDYLYLFNEIRPIFDGDLGQLIGIDEGGLGGVAITIDGLCSTNNFSYSDLNFSYDTVPNFSWTVQVIAHELGHLLGSPHTHACVWNGNNTAIDGCGQSKGYRDGSCADGPIPDTATKGTIMSYCHLVPGVGISFSNGFGPQPAELMKATVDNATCLSTDCVNTCINTLSALTVSAISQDSATITWTDQGGASNTQISVFPLSTPSGTWDTPATTTYAATGLTPNTYYKVLIRRDCSASGLEPTELALLFVTMGDFCSGISLTDSGGILGNYRNSETTIRTIVPNNPNAKAKVTFNSFDLEKDYDYLYVYNGSDTTFPDLSNGGFTGNTIPSPIESTAADGSLTMQFYSDTGVVAAGYEATVSCLTLGTHAFDSAIDFTYYPNPTHGSIVIKSPNPMSEVLVYNLEGRLLWQQKINTLETTVDLAAFANGTYFFKLKFKDQTANFKIMKFN